MKKYRIKSMKELLEENPDAFFDEYGDLFINDDCMFTDRFQYLGKTLDNLPKCQKFHKSWYEVIEEELDGPYYSWEFISPSFGKLVQTIFKKEGSTTLDSCKWKRKIAGPYYYNSEGIPVDSEGNRLKDLV